MGTISRTAKSGGGTNFNSGQTIDPAEVNTDLNTVYTEMNGLVDDGNVETATIPGAKTLRFTEITAPSNPSANDLLLYALEQSGSQLATRNSAGTVRILGTGLEIIRKTANNAVVNNSTTLVNDDHLLAALAVNEVVVFLAHVFHIGNTVADFKFTFTVPTGAALSWNFAGGLQMVAGETLGAGVTRTTSGTTHTVAGSTSSYATTLLGIVRNGSTAGNLQFQFAQDTAAVVDTYTQIDSFLAVLRL